MLLRIVAKLLFQCQLALSRPVFDDVPSYGAGRDSQRTCEVHLTRTAASRKVSVLRADDDLVRPYGHTRPGVDASPATRLDNFHSCFLEDF